MSIKACERCGETGKEELLSECNLCGALVCNQCSVRVGGRIRVCCQCKEDEELNKEYDERNEMQDELDNNEEQEW